MSDYTENLFPKISRAEALKIMSQADEAFELQQFRKAIRLFSQSLRAPLSDLDKGYILYMKGKAYQEIGDMGRACQQWSRAIELDLTQHPMGIDIVNDAYKKYCV
ncbi:MAG TPA: hypothetical protein DCS93_10145 [Microscillaceae bacterium]|nr:hypothetical protein [Microscillaceae bacterium]